MKIFALRAKFARRSGNVLDLARKMSDLSVSIIGCCWDLNFHEHKATNQGSYTDLYGAPSSEKIFSRRVSYLVHTRSKHV